MMKLLLCSEEAQALRKVCILCICVYVYVCSEGNQSKSPSHLFTYGFYLACLAHWCDPRLLEKHHL